jgi:hypothetical protein
MQSAEQYILARPLNFRRGASLNFLIHTWNKPIWFRTGHERPLEKGKVFRTQRRWGPKCFLHFPEVYKNQGLWNVGIAILEGPTERWSQNVPTFGKTSFVGSLLVELLWSLWRQNQLEDWGTVAGFGAALFWKPQPPCSQQTAWEPSLPKARLLIRAII